ncbi:uncharacterized protein LOC135838872 [Planococcus citri]|uniref:uncharacterized protein LOC135838872 n=1 Tax=Planococcus citri TaxID=170843 RepID=UPI0031F809E9
MNRNRKVNFKELNESDFVTFLDKYFVDFEDNLRCNNFGNMNTLLIKNIIEKFGKIFQLWDENRFLQASIDKNFFENIHKLMQYAFNVNDHRRNEPTNYSDDFTLECNHCGDAFPLRNKDCQYSFELHEISKEHTEFLRNLNNTDSDTSSSSCHDSDNEIQTDPTVSVGGSDSKDDCSSDDQVEHRLQPIRWPLTRINDGTIKHIDEGLRLSSKLAEVSIVKEIPEAKRMRITPTEKSAAGSKFRGTPVRDQISISTSNNDDGLSISEFDTSCIIFKNNRLRCKICSVSLSHETCAIDHMKGKPHSYRTKLYESYGSFLKETDDNKMQCIVCECQYAIIHKFFKHCQTKAHEDRVSQLKMQPSELYIARAVAEFMQCPASGCFTFVSDWKQLFEHVQSFHKK